MVSYEKGRQILEAVVSFFNTITYPFKIEGRSPEDFIKVSPDDFWWFLFGAIPPLSLFLAMTLVRHLGVVLITSGGGYVIHMFTLLSVVYWYRDKPFRIIGAKMKFMIEVIPVIIAAAFHHLLEFDYRYLALILCCSTTFYFYAHFMRASYDIGGIDVLLGLVMQILVYLLNVELLVRALTLSLCFGLCFYRYMTYRAPQLPVHRKKELEQVPC